jgi:hypothetical protein
MRTRTRGNRYLQKNILQLSKSYRQQVRRLHRLPQILHLYPHRSNLQRPSSQWLQRAQVSAPLERLRIDRDHRQNHLMDEGLLRSLLAQIFTAIAPLDQMEDLK